MIARKLFAAAALASMLAGSAFAQTAQPAAPAKPAAPAAAPAAKPATPAAATQIQKTNLNTASPTELDKLHLHQSRDVSVILDHQYLASCHGSSLPSFRTIHPS